MTKTRAAPCDVAMETPSGARRASEPRYRRIRASVSDAEEAAVRKAASAQGEDGYTFVRKATLDRVNGASVAERFFDETVEKYWALRIGIERRRLDAVQEHLARVDREKRALVHSLPARPTSEQRAAYQEAAERLASAHFSLQEEADRFEARIRDHERTRDSQLAYAHTGQPVPTQETNP